MAEETKNYEITFLLQSDAGKEEVIKNIKDNQFSVVADLPMPRIKLAYPIKKEEFAYFGCVYFSGEPANIQKLSESLKTGSKVLRFSIAPQPIFKEGEERKAERVPAAQIRRFSEKPKEREVYTPPTSTPIKRPVQTEALSNEALEKKLEEILN